MPPKQNIGGFPTLQDAMRGFLTEWLEIKAMRQSAKLFKIDDEFIAFLVSRSVEQTRAIDLAAVGVFQLTVEIDMHVKRWTAQGAASPFHRSADEEHVVVAWQHSSYECPEGLQTPSQGYFDIYLWLGTLKNAEFLFPCLCYLRTLGCDPVFLTDGSGDEGVDCIGVVSGGAMRSTVVFVQAKSTLDGCSANEIRIEYAKYQALPRTDMYMRYLSAMGIMNSKAGAAYIYVLISNGDIRGGAWESAPKLGVLLRTRRQLAATLAERYTHQQLLTLKASTQVPSTRNLAMNLAPLL